MIAIVNISDVFSEKGLQKYSLRINNKMRHKNYLSYKCKCGFEIEIFTDDLKTGEKDLKKAIKKHKCPAKCPKGVSSTRLIC